MMAKERDKRFQSGNELIQFINGFLTTQELVSPSTTRPETATVSLEEPTIQTSGPPIAGLPTAQRKKKKWLVPIIAAAVVLAAVSLYFILREPLKEKDKTVPIDPPIQQTEETREKKQPLEQPTTDKEEQPIDAGTETETKKDTETSLDTKKGTDQSKQDTGKKEITPPKEEQKPVEKKIDTKEAKPGQKYVTDVKPTEKQKKTEPLKVEKREEKPKPVKKEVQPPELKTVNLLGLSPSLRQEYREKVQRIPIPVPVRKARFQVHGQITLSLFIDENGKVTVSSFKELLTVKPARRKSNVIAYIKFRINNISLTPPQDKDGNPVRFDWRVTFKVGKYLNKIILTRQ